MSSGPGPICYSCIHKQPRLLACDAFPDRIPVPILLNEADHRKEFKGDKGIQFEQDPHQPEPPENVLKGLDAL